MSKWSRWHDCLETIRSAAVAGGFTPQEIELATTELSILADLADRAENNEEPITEPKSLLRNDLLRKIWIPRLIDPEFFTRAKGGLKLGLDHVFANEKWVDGQKGLFNVIPSDSP